MPKANLTDLPSCKPRSRSAIISFLSDHFRYSTMNSWNRSTSYAVRIKASHLNLPSSSRTAVYEALDIPSCYSASGFSRILREFDASHSQRWQIGTNGRSGGYCVLYQGGQRDSGYKSCCEDCGQYNYTLATPEADRCGRCRTGTRVNLTAPVISTFAYPGKSLDMDEDFSSWGTSSLRDRLSLVWDFDLAVERACRAFLAWALTHRPVQRTIMVPKTITVAAPRE